MAPKVDPTVLEQEYVTGEVSIRELARRHDMSWSTISARARRENWTDKRDSYRDAVKRRSYERTADRYAHEHAEIRSEAVVAMRATIRQYITQLTNGEIKISPKDASGAVQTLMLLLGEPTARTESKVVEFSTGGLDPEVLRRLEELTRARLVEGTATDVAGPRPAGVVAD